MSEIQVNKITKVTEHYWNCIDGFKFYDENDEVIFEIGFTQGEICTVEIDQQKTICGFKAKLHPT